MQSFETEILAAEENFAGLAALEALAFVAGHTERVALGASVLVVPLYNPILLARQLTTLDVLSKGRLRIGLGGGRGRTLGWIDSPALAGHPAREAMPLNTAVWRERQERPSISWRTSL